MYVGCIFGGLMYAECTSGVRRTYAGFTPRIHPDVRLVYTGCTPDVRRMCAGCTAGVYWVPDVRRAYAERTMGLHWYTSCVCRVYTGYTPGVHRVYAGCAPGVHCVYSQCSPGVHSMYTTCTPGVRRVYAGCTPGVRRVYAGCTPGIRRMPSVPVRPWSRCRWSFSTASHTYTNPGALCLNVTLSTPLSHIHRPWSIVFLCHSVHTPLTHTQTLEHCVPRSPCPHPCHTYTDPGALCLHVTLSTHTPRHAVKPL